MKKLIKRFFITILSIIIIIGIIFQFTKTKYFNILANKIIDIVGIDASIEEIKRDKGLSFIISNLKVNEYSGEKFLSIDKAKVQMSLLAPTRILNVSVKGGDVVIKREPESFNYERIFAPSDTNEINSITRISRFGNIEIDEFKAKFIDKTMKEKIDLDLYDVKGSIKNSLINLIKIKLNAKTIGVNRKKEEKIGLKIEFVEDKKISVLSQMTYPKEFVNADRTHMYMEFNFKDVDVDNNLFQYVPLDIMEVKSAVLDGDVSLTYSLPDIDKKRELEFYGNLKIKDGILNYKDYYDTLKGIEADILLNKDVINVKGQTQINKGDVKLEILTNLTKQSLLVKGDFKNIDYKDIKKYSLINSFNVDAKGRASGNIETSIDLKKGNVNYLVGEFTSSKIETFGVNLVDTVAKIEMQNDEFKLKSLKTKVSKHINDEINVSSNVDLKLDMNIKTKDVNAKYSLTNIKAPLDVKNIKGVASIKNMRKISTDLYLDDINIKANYDLKTTDLLLKTKGGTKKTLTLGEKQIELLPNIDYLKYNVRENKLVDSNMKLDLDLSDKFKGDIYLKAKSENDKFILDSKVILNDSEINLNGEITKDFNVNMNASGNDVDVKEVLKNLNIKNKLLDEIYISPLNFKVNVSGNKKGLKGKFEISNKSLDGPIEYKDLYMVGEFQNTKPLDFNLDFNLDEFWFMYHKLDNIKGNINYEDKILTAKLENDNLNSFFSLDVLEDKINFYTELNNYVFYNTSSPDVNLHITNLYANLYGSTNDLNGYVKINNSPIIIEEVDAGDLNVDVKLKDNVVYLENMSIRDSRISGKYYLDNNYIDLLAKINENSLLNLIGIDDGNIDINSEIKISGELDKLEVLTDTHLKNIYYKNYKLPNLDLNVNYINMDYKNLLKSGQLEINDFKIYNDTYSYKTQYNMIDLETLNFDYHVVDKEIDLSQFNAKDSNTLQGKINLNLDLEGKLDTLFTNIYLTSKDVSLNGIKLNNIYLDMQANRSGANINRIYLEYANNPFTIDGYITVNPLDYNMKLVADNMNLSFLKINSNIKDANGEANINFLASKEKTEGDIYIDNFKLKTNSNLINIDNLVTDINLENRKININQFTGVVNNGIIDLYGRIDIPEIPNNFLETKRLKLGVIDLHLGAENIDIAYNEIKTNLSTKIDIKEDNLIGKLLINSGEVKGIPSFGESNKKKESYFSVLLNEVGKKIIDQYNVNTSVEIETPIKLDIQNILILKDIKGDITGEASLIYTNGESLLEGGLSINNSSFKFNKYKFNIENLDVLLNSGLSGLSIDPEINLRATTNIGDEEVEIDMTGKLSEKNIKFKSSTGKTQDEILSLLALNLTGLTKENDKGDFNPFSIFKNTNILGVALETTINEFLFSKLTNPVQSLLGLSNFNIKTNLNSEGSLNFTDIFKDTSTTLSIQKPISNVNNIYFNTELIVPFDFSSSFTDKLKYNMWLSHDFNKGFSVNVGMKTINKYIDSRVGNNIAFYGGLNYSKKTNTLSELIDSLKDLFNKRTELIKEEK